MTETAKAFDIDPRFDADHHVFGQDVLAAQGHPGRLMPGDPKSVAGAVQDVFAKACIFDYPKRIKRARLSKGCQNSRMGLVFYI